MDLQGKRVVITGASSGIGLELVKHLLRENCKIVAVARNINKIKITHPNLTLISCDVSSKEGVDILFSKSLEVLHEIDLFVANAGFAYYEKITKPDWEHAKAIFDTNLLSLVYSAEKMKELHQSKPFNFVAIASGMSFLSLPGYALYSGTKAAIRGFADAYRWELVKGQYLQVVYPIATKTNFFNYAGGSPLPWPVQDVQTVARSIKRGIQKNRQGVYPSKLFVLFNYFGRLLPFINKVYLTMENKKFKKWLASK